jgi:hypothetical protein
MEISIILLLSISFSCCQILYQPENKEFTDFHNAFDYLAQKSPLQKIYVIKDLEINESIQINISIEIM